MRAKETLELTRNGGGIECKTDSEGTWLTWYTPPGMMFGVMHNSAESRRFLRAALRRMDKESQSRPRQKRRAA